jgi:hypothetical protein
MLAGASIRVAGAGDKGDMYLLPDISRQGYKDRCPVLVEYLACVQVSCAVCERVKAPYAIGIAGIYIQRSALYGISGTCDHIDMKIRLLSGQVALAHIEYRKVIIGKARSGGSGSIGVCDGLSIWAIFEIVIGRDIGPAIAYPCGVAIATGVCHGDIDPICCQKGFIAPGCGGDDLAVLVVDIIAGRVVWPQLEAGVLEGGGIQAATARAERVEAIGAFPAGEIAI